MCDYDVHTCKIAVVVIAIILGYIGIRCIVYAPDAYTEYQESLARNKQEEREFIRSLIKDAHIDVSGYLYEPKL